MATIPGKYLDIDGLSHAWGKVKPVLSELVDDGAKNVLSVFSPPLGSVVTTHGRTFEVLSDGGIKITGSASDSSNADFYLVGRWGEPNVVLPLSDDNYVAVLKCESSSASGVNLAVYDRQSGSTDHSSRSGCDVQSTGVQFSFDVTTVFVTVTPSITLPEGGITVYPMICKKSEWDVSKKFVPYSKTNSVLTVEALEDHSELVEVIDKGAKNLFPNTATTQTIGDVTFTVNSDGSITANGTKTNNNWFYLSTGNSLKAGTYVLFDGLPNGTVDCQLLIATSTSYTSSILRTGVDSRPDIKRLTQNYTNLNYAIRIASGTRVDNLTFYPMICKKEDWDMSSKYVPYAPTNREIYNSMYRSHSILPDSVDIDTIKIGGLYAGVNSTGNTASHMPVSNGSFSFSLMVLECNETIIQVFKQLNGAGDPYVYIRRFYIWNTSWDSWYKFTGVQV